MSYPSARSYSWTGHLVLPLIMKDYVRAVLDYWLDQPSDWIVHQHALILRDYIKELEMSQKSVLILGSGAAAAFAYVAARDWGGTKINILTNRHGRPSAGAFYFHWLPDSIIEQKIKRTEKETVTQTSIEPEDIYVTSYGTKKGYLKKQWGEKKYKTSFPKKDFVTEGYDPVKAWDLLWREANVDILVGNLSRADIKDMGSSVDFVFQTFPMFETTQARPKTVDFLTLYKKSPKGPGDDWAWALEYAPNFIIYNGEPDTPWVRCSYLFGHLFYEYPAGAEIEVPQGWQKRLQPDMHPKTKPWKKAPYPEVPNIHLVGRYAQWNRKMLSHDSYWRTFGILNGDITNKS